MTTRLSKAHAEEIAKRLNESVRFRGQFNALLHDLDHAERVVRDAQSKLGEKRAALAKFFGLSTKASLYELEMAAKAVTAARKGR